MKFRKKSFIWYHLLVDLGNHYPNDEKIDQLFEYIEDKKEELNLDMVFYASYIDHFHFLFPARSDIAPDVFTDNLLNSITWFLSVSGNEPVENIKKSVLITISPDQVESVIAYMKEHVKHHLERDIDYNIERSGKEWKALRKTQY